VPDAAQQSAESESQQDEVESQQTEVEPQQTETEQTEAETQQTEAEQTEAESQQTEVESQQMETEQQQTDDSSGREATSADASSGFGEDSPGVGTVEVIDSGDLTPQKEDDSLAPDLGGGSDSARVDRSGKDQTTDDAETKENTQERDDSGTDQAEDTAETGQEESVAEGPGQVESGNADPDEVSAESEWFDSVETDRDEEETDQDEAEALHVYAVGFDAGVDSWVAIAEIDPDAELTDAEPLFREWATRTYHDQIVDRLAIGPSEYNLEE
jgi:hypothetical protein